MNRAVRATVVTLLGAASLFFWNGASAQIDLPSPDLPGSSPGTAVRIVAANDLMVDRLIQRWLHTHYPGWDADPVEYQDIGTEHYAVVYITSPNNPGRRVYFRVASRMNDPDDDGVLNPLGR
jgi:hypothetical protein